MNKAFKTRARKPPKGSIIHVDNVGSLVAGDKISIQGKIFVVQQPLTNTSMTINPLGYGGGL